jgi:hypothetical protein
MKDEVANHASLSDADLLLEVQRLASGERQATVRLIAALGELDVRRLYLGAGCASLFTYCTQVLHLSEHSAYGRIEAARAARRWPMLLERVADGSLHLTAVALLSRHLTPENHQALVAAARHKSKREIEEIVAALRPQPDVPSTMRKLPAPEPSAPAVHLSQSAAASPSATPPASVADHPQRTSGSTARRAALTPLAPERYRVQLTVSRETYEKLRTAQDLLRHRLPVGDLAAILDRALTLLLRELHKTKHAAVDRPRGQQAVSHGRHIPAVVRRHVWERDEGRCAFIGVAGRCTERGLLEYHHVVPFADGGATTVENLALRCRAHNRYEAHLWSGTVDGIGSVEA